MPSRLPPARDRVVAAEAGPGRGGCRAFSPLSVHCLATGQQCQIFDGYSGAGCGYPKGEFLDITVTVEL